MWSWILPAIFLAVAGMVSWRRIPWTTVASVLLFAALNAAFGVYVLTTFRDARWSADGEPPLTAPSLSGTPLVGQFLGPLDSALKGVVGQANDVLAFKQALPAALEFLATSGWALLLSFPVAILAAVISFRRARRRAADFEKYRAAVDLLRRELEEVKRQMPSATHPHEKGTP